MVKFAALDRGPILATGDPALHLALEGAEGRVLEIRVLMQQLSAAMRIVGNLNLVNDLISRANRPDLFIKERAEQRQIVSVLDVTELDNFVPCMCNIGPAVLGASHEGKQEIIGRRDLDHEEKKLYFSLAGRGFSNALDERT